MGRRLWPSGVWGPGPHRGKSPAETLLHRTPCKSTSDHSWGGDTELGWAHGRATWGLPGGGQGNKVASPEIAANVGHHIGVVALTQDGDFLLKGADVVPWGAQGIMGGGRREIALTQCPHLQRGTESFSPRCLIGAWRQLLQGPASQEVSEMSTLALTQRSEALCPPSSAEALAPGPHLGLASLS